MRLKFVDNIITAEEHALWSKEETNNKLAIEEKIQTLRLVDNDFEKEVIQMLELANRSHELFKSSDVDQKRQIISLLLPNLFLDGENLDYTLIKPFDNMVNLGNRPNWLPKAYDVRTPEYASVISHYERLHSVEELLMVA